MLDNSFKEYLDEEFGRIMPEQQEKYREMFKKLGFGEVNHDFVEFWSTYSDEMSWMTIFCMIKIRMKFSLWRLMILKILLKIRNLADTGTALKVL